MKKPVVLRIYKGDQLQGVKQFLDAQIVIGTQGEQVQLDGSGVSLIHASIEERADGYYVSDLGSEQGTLKNGEKVLDAKLESGDSLGIGDFRVEFYIGVPKPKTDGTQVTTVKPPAAQTPPPVQTQAVATPPPVAPKAPEKKAEPELQLQTDPNIDISKILPPPSFAKAPEKPVEKPATEKSADTPVAKTEAPASQPIKPVPPPPTVKPVQTPIAQKTGPTPVAPPAPKPNPNTLSGSPSAPAAPAANRTETGSAAAAVAGGAMPHVAPPSRARQNTARKVESGHGSKGFAPPSKYRDVKEFVKPQKGTVIEVLVAWRERVIATHHFSGSSNGPRTINIGSQPDNDIVLPLISSKVRTQPLVKIQGQAIVFIPAEASGELVKAQASAPFVELIRQNRMVKTGALYSLNLDQGEMVKIELSDQVSIIVRYTSDSPKPIMGPLLDLSTSELAGIVLSVALVATLWLYMFLYVPPKALGDDALTEEPMRTALIITKPTPKPLPPPAPPEPPKVEPTPPPQVVKVKVQEKKAVEPPKAAQKKETAQAANLTNKQDPGKSAAAAPNKNKTGPRTQTSVKQGGAIKTSDKEGSQMQSKSKDVSKAGVFSVFGGGGAQDKLAGSTTGSGELAGLASAASGKAGSAVNRPGQGLGSDLKDTGMGGNGKAFDGIAGGVGTTGRGSGNSGYGTGGLGTRQGMKIVTGGAEEVLPTSIDREAIRRVILANLRVIRTCYERQLNRRPDLFGKLVLSWDIGEQGRVVAVRTKSNELGSREVADCIMDRLKTWRFPEPPSNQIVEVEAYPFFFSN